MPEGTEDMLSAGIGVSVPNTFSEDQFNDLIFPEEGQVQISRFEIVGPGNAVLLILEPPPSMTKVHSYQLYFRGSKPPELGEMPLYDKNFTLPNDLEIWEMDNPEYDKYKIFIPEADISCKEKILITHSI